MLKWLRRGQCWEIYRGKLAEFNDWFNVRKEKLRWLQHYGFGDQMEDEKREQRSRLVGRHAVLVVCGAVKWVCPAGSCILVVVFSHSVVSDSLWPHGLQAQQAPLTFTIAQSLLKLMSIELVMPSNHLILCCSLLLLPTVFPSILYNWGVYYIFWNALAFWLIQGKTQDSDNMILFVGLIEVYCS